MAVYRAKHDVAHNQVGYSTDEIVRFTDAELADYADFQSGPIAQLLAAGAIEGERPRADVPVAEQSVEQLVAIAAALGLPIAEPLDRTLILASIAEARARLAAPAPGNAPPLPPIAGRIATAEGAKTTPSDPGGGYVPLSAELGLDRLAEIAVAEGATYVEGAGVAAILAAIETKRAGASDLPALTGTRGTLVDIAIAEGVEFASNASRADLIAAIEAKRATPPTPEPGA